MSNELEASAIYLALARKALSSPTTIKIRFPSKTAAVKARVDFHKWRKLNRDSMSLTPDALQTVESIHMSIAQENGEVYLLVYKAGLPKELLEFLQGEGEL